MRCCFNSVDENNYSKINVAIPPLHSKYVSVRCDSFTCNCNIRVLNQRDYISMTVGDTPFTAYFTDDYTNLNAEIFAELLNTMLEEAHGVKCQVDNCNRLYFVSQSMFWFNDMSYNVKLLMGLYSMKDEDIRAEKVRAELGSGGEYKLKINSVGMYLSTPVLNLVSNIGDASFRNNSDDICNLQSCSTVLRINNSFSPNIPIVASGDGSLSIIPSGCVGGAVFVLVDANMHQIDLLSPMYIALTLEPLAGYDV